MEEAITVLYAVVIVIVAAATIFTGIDVFLALKAAKVAPEYFNIWYKPEHGTGLFRAHLVGKVYRLDNRALYLVEIHPEDATKAHAWTVPKMELRGVYLLEKEKFYKLAFKEELYA